MRPMYFHTRTDLNPIPGILPHTVCIDNQDNTAVIGYAVTNENDKFCRKTGRDISLKKLNILKQIDINNCKKFKNTDALIPTSVDFYIKDIIKRFIEVRKVKIDNVKIFALNSHRKIPVLIDWSINE